MGLYDQNVGFNLAFGDSKKILYIILAVLIVLAIGAIAFFAMQEIKPSALNFRFEKNPIKTGETTKVIVTVTNIGEFDAVNVPVSLGAKESTELQVFPENFSGKIANLSAETSREVTFVINPVRNILPGTYVLVARTTINGEEYEKETVLTVQK